MCLVSGDDLERAGCTVAVEALTTLAALGLGEGSPQGAKVGFLANALAGQGNGSAVANTYGLEIRVSFAQASKGLVNMDDQAALEGTAKKLVGFLPGALKATATALGGWREALDEAVKAARTVSVTGHEVGRTSEYAGLPPYRFYLANRLGAPTAKPMNTIRHVTGAYMQYLVDLKADVDHIVASAQRGTTDPAFLRTSVQRLQTALLNLRKGIMLKPEQVRYDLLKHQFYGTEGANIMGVPVPAAKLSQDYEMGMDLCNSVAEDYLQRMKVPLPTPWRPTRKAPRFRPVAQRPSRLEDGRVAEVDHVAPMPRPARRARARPNSKARRASPATRKVNVPSDSQLWQTTESDRRAEKRKKLDLELQLLVKKKRIRTKKTAALGGGSETLNAVRSHSHSNALTKAKYGNEDKARFNWSDEEHRRFLVALEKYKEYPKKWIHVAEFVDTRTAHQCRGHYAAYTGNRYRTRKAKARKRKRAPEAQAASRQVGVRPPGPPGKRGKRPEKLL